MTRTLLAMLAVCALLLRVATEMASLVATVAALITVVVPVVIYAASRRRHATRVTAFVAGRSQPEFTVNVVLTVYTILMSSMGIIFLTR